MSLSPVPERAVAGVRARDARQWDGSTDRRHLLAVCNATVGLYKAVFGRGPVKASAEFAGPDVVVIVLEHTLTTAERNLAALGQHDRLQEMRLIAHRALEGDMRSIAERILGRRAVASLSAIDVRRDLAAEVLTLEPEPYRPPLTPGTASAA